MDGLPLTPEDQIGIGLAKIGMVIRHLAWQEAIGLGLNPTQAQILAYLQGKPGGTATMSEIASALAVTLPTVSDSVASLESKGWVSRRKADHDGRSVQAVLTEAGRRQASAAMIWTDFLSEAVRELSPAEQSTLLRGLLKMIRHLQRAGKISVARMCLSCTYFRPNAHDDPEHPHHCAFVNAPLGDRELRLECPDHVPADPESEQETWRRFLVNEPSAL